MGSESSHCSTMGRPTSMDLLLSESGSRENLAGGATGVLLLGMSEI